MSRCKNCQAVNVEDAEFCAQCGFTILWDDTVAEPPAQPVEQYLTLEPEHVRVVVGERASVRLAGGLPTGLSEARWLLVGGAAEWSQVLTPAPGELRVDLAPPARELPRSLPLELRALIDEVPVASARGTVELLASVTEPAPEPPPPPRRGLMIWAAAAVAIATLAVVLFLVLGDRGVGGRVNSQFATLVVHSTPRGGTGNLVRPFLANGQEVSVICRDGAFAKLDEGRYVFLSELDLDGTPPPCE